MAHFEPAYKITRASEGGYANSSIDKGGETWRGVSRKYNPNWAGWKIVDAIKATNPANLNHALAENKELEALVLALFRKDYWDILALDTLHCQQTANQLFDVSVNCGHVMAGKFLQRAINVFHKPELDANGKVGPITIGAANQYPAQKIYDEITKQRQAYYEAIIAKDDSQKVYRNSWMARIQPYQPDNTGNIA